MSTNAMQKRRFRINNISLLVTIILFTVMFIFGSVNYKGFFSLQTIFNLFINNAHLIIASVGMTLVIITGGIDISIASNLAFTCMTSAYLLQLGWSPAAVIPLVLIIGLAFGYAMGFIIENYEIQPFIVTLAGQFLLRGLCFVISRESISINNQFYIDMGSSQIRIFGSHINYSVIIALLVVIAAFIVLKYTNFGRNIFAVGGNKQSAVLMGLPVKGVSISVYAINGFLAALAGVIYSFWAPSGYGLQNAGMEMDAISAAVIGGTLLTGGVGSVIGTVFGVLINGIIQTLVTFQGNLNSWWTRVTIASLLAVFIILQSAILMRTKKTKGKSKGGGGGKREKRQAA